MRRRPLIGCGARGRGGGRGRLRGSGSDPGVGAGPGPLGSGLGGALVPPRRYRPEMALGSGTEGGQCRLPRGPAGPLFGRCRRRPGAAAVRPRGSSPTEPRKEMNPPGAGPVSLAGSLGSGQAVGRLRDGPQLLQATGTHRGPNRSEEKPVLTTAAFCMYHQA